MFRIAAIDIGTNSTRLLVADIAGGNIKVIKTGLVTTRLGEGISGGRLLPGAMDRTAKAVSFFNQQAQLLGAKQVAAAATSAVRDAANREEIISLIRQQTGLQVRVLSGEQEASLSYKGVLSNLAVEPDSTVVADIGGGSTELIWMEKAHLRCASVNVGAVRMTEAGMGEKEIAEGLGPILSQIERSRLKNLVGVGGTVTTLAAIDQRMIRYDPGLAHGYFLKAGSVKNIITRLKNLDLAERKKVPGLQPERADIIIAGAWIVKAVMEGLGMAQMQVSECDILFGMALEKVEIK